MNQQAQTQQLSKLLKQGFAALSAGKLTEANRCCQAVLKAEPNLVQGHFLVGLVALEAKDRKTAFRAFGTVTRLQKNHAAAWAQLARIFMTDGQVNRADTALENAVAALQQDPQTQDPLVQDLLGSIYSLMGDYDEAGLWFKRATNGQPDQPPFLLNLANNLIYRGQIEESVDIHRRIIEIQPQSPQAHWSLSGARKAKDERHIDELSQLLKADNLHPRTQAFYCYAMGKELEDLNHWDRAIQAFHQGAAARRKTVEYDEPAEIAMFNYLQTQFTTNWLESGGSGNSGNPSAAPIFILGQPRTGTTLIERVIGSHSQVQSAGELQQFGLAIRRLAQIQDPKRFSVALFEAAQELEPEKIGSLYLETSKKMRGDSPRFIDKLPQNYLFIPLILKALPNARIVHLTRSAEDACFSSYKQLFADAYLHSYDQEEMARHHCRYRELMAVWRERFGERFIDISYEATVSDLEPHARALLDFLELPWEDACLHFHQQQQGVATASAVQVREPAHTRSVGRWRHYESEIQPMLKILRENNACQPQ